MSKKTAVWLVFMLGMVVGWSAPVSRAQENAAPAKPAAEETDKAGSAYRLDFSVNELEDGKKVNTRQYSMNVVPGFSNTNELKIGTRVPVTMKQGEVQYLDVGTNIWCRMPERGTQLDIRLDLSNFADNGQENRGTPLLRQLRISASTVAVPGRPTVVGIVDDPNSKRQYQLEVTLTKLR